MEKKTHVALGNLVSLAYLQPTSVSGLMITVGSATLGSILPDVDLKDSTTDKLFDRLITSFITVIIVGVFVNYFFDINIYHKIKEFSNIYNYILCVVVFSIMSYMGSKTHHRSFTHSILGLFIYSFILSYGFKETVVVPFFMAYLSHILIDLLNKKGLTLFYPIKKRFCFDLCDSHGTVNSILFTLFSFLNFITLIVICVKG